MMSASSSDIAQRSVIARNISGQPAVLHFQLVFVRIVAGIVYVGWNPRRTKIRHSHTFSHNSTAAGTEKERYQAQFQILIQTVSVSYQSYAGEIVNLTNHLLHLQVRSTTARS